MNLYSVSIPLLCFCFLITFRNSGNNPTTHVTGDLSVSCGSTGKSTALDGQEWIGDVINPKSTSYVQIKGSSAISTANNRLISGDEVLHRTARISRSIFSYTFRVGPGQKILRLHFYSAPYKSFKGLKDLFTVQAGPFTLLGNFSASLTADALGLKSFTKEFCLSVQENEQFTVTFIPETSQSLDAYAFVNGIEIISVPANVPYFQGFDNGVQVVGQKSTVYVGHHTALELIHRSIITQSYGQSEYSGGTLPLWAVRKAKQVANKTWRVPVDVGFKYLIRLQFSEIGLKISGTRDVKFRVLINGMIARTNIDLVKEISPGESKNIPWYYEDYLVTIRGRKEEGKRDLSISLHSHDELMDGLQLLSAFEIFKLSNPDNSLASPNSLPPPAKPFLIFFSNRTAFSFVATMLLCLLSITVHKLREYSEAELTEAPEKKNKPSARAERLCRRFSLVEIQSATRNFNDGLLIGSGGFGKVYKGLIDRGQKTVAIKRLKSNSTQGAREFLMEIETLSELRHVNLVSLIGYCNENREMILVYDYMSGGTLADHLYKLWRTNDSFSKLNWKQRLAICIGAARGLDYLHTGCRIIHRDVKSSNILLDEDFAAKVSDFGLAKHVESNKLQSHISTQVKGTRGYMDPHYFRTRKLTMSTDTYAFGVVLFETLCGRAAVDLNVAEEEHILTVWARDKISKGEVDRIVDSSLRVEILKGSLKTFAGIAERCLHEDPKSRPSMSQVVQQLKLALDQQNNGLVSVTNEVRSDFDEIHTINDEIEVPTKASTYMPTSPPHLNRDGNKRTGHKQSRVWPWAAFFSRAIAPRRNDLLQEIEEANLRLLKFDWDTIVAATNVFSSSNKVGHDSFGPVYKGVLPTTRQLVAIKIFSPSSSRGQNEYINEIRLLPSLQHQNIIKLLGYCIHREEKLIVYEFMENRSLQTFIGGNERRRQLLTWPVRFEIIKGIARGVVYLHQDSGLSVIHRNLGVQSILLDSKMIPKISNFTFYRSMGEIHLEMETSKVAGTCSYMCPELVMHGIVSVKTDVYSFGIVALEVLCGRKMGATTFLLDNGWKLWKEGKALDLVDDSLGGAFEAEEALRCIQVGLLCIEEQPHHRPTMYSVLKMLDGHEPLVNPQQPFPLALAGNLSSARGSLCSDATFEINDVLER
ncbi:Putative receptor-like protein kinase [Striga hermonthica]|uniref:non-specific serine/threonine protein kinase n=1 Tax=Striga hermonthica TaxID=68872 RepID=A0A9N7N0L8_STRHE|nr:Putative receptor-like protein kinase [Striga hermonthica]